MNELVVDEISPAKSKKGKSKKRDTPSKSEGVEIEDKSLRSSRTKVINSNETQVVVEEEKPKKPAKISKKKVLAAERGNSIIILS
jgi:hypothetical protein